MSVRRPRRVSPMRQHHAVVTLTFAEVGTCMDRSASVGCIRITNPDHRITPIITDQLRISHRITSGSRRNTHGSRITPDRITPDHVQNTPDHVRIPCRNTHGSRITPDRINTGSRPEHTGSRPDHVPEHVRITYQTAGPDQHRITSGDHAGTHRITSGRHGRIRARHTRSPSSSSFFHLAISSPWNLSRGAPQMAHEEKCAPLL